MGLSYGSGLLCQLLAALLLDLEGAVQEERQIIFDGEKLDMEAVWKVRDGFFAR